MDMVSSCGYENAIKLQKKMPHPTPAKIMKKTVPLS
jgi:hypothetical protein